MRPILLPLALAACVAAVRPVHAQSAAPPATQSDSAAVLSLAVDELLRADSASDPIKPQGWGYEWKDPEANIAGHPRVFVRIGKMPFGAWARPSIARLRAWRWRFNGWAVDSTRAQQELADLPGRHYPVTLNLRIAFEGNFATVEESWDPLTCEVAPESRHPISITGRVLVRSPSGWRYDEALSPVFVTDGPCSGGGMHAGGASRP